MQSNAEPEKKLEEIFGQQHRTKKSAKHERCFADELFFYGEPSDDGFKLCNVLANLFVTEFVVLQITVYEEIVTGHVDQSVAGKIEEDDLLFARLFALRGLTNGGCNGMAALGSRDDALSASKEHAGLECLNLRNVDTAHQSVFEKLRHDHSGSVVTQTAGMDVGRLELVAQREHGEQRRVASLIAKVVLELAACQLRTALWLGSNELGGLAVLDVVTHKGEGDAAEVATAAKAGNHHVGIFASHSHLLLGLQSDDGLMERHMVEHRTQRVFAVGRGGGQFHGLADGCAERAGVVGIDGDDVLARTG